MFFAIIKFDKGLIRCALADETFLSITDIPGEDFLFRPLIDSLGMFAAFHEAGLAHDFMSSIWTDELHYFLIEAF